MLGTRVPLWIKLDDVPLCLWSKRGLGYVASFIGRPLQMDALTASRKNLEFARVCIKVNLEENLPEVIYPNMEGGSRVPIKVIYAWKPTMCSFCKIVGHEQDACPKLINQEAHPKPVTNQPIHFNPNAPFPKPKPGMRNEWTTVTRKKLQESAPVTKPDHTPLIPHPNAQIENSISALPNDQLKHQATFVTKNSAKSITSPNAFNALQLCQEEEEAPDLALGGLL